MDYPSEMTVIGKRAGLASRRLAIMPTADKNACLEGIAAAIDDARDAISGANRTDMDAGRDGGLTAALLDRLELTPGRIDAIITGLHDMVGLDDPVGVVDREVTLENGLRMQKVRVPIGVIGIIYESRPNVTVDAAGLCLKAGNAIILRGGSEAVHSNRALAAAINDGGARAGLPEFAVQLLPWQDREAVTAMLKLDEHIHLIIPRGGEGLIRYVTHTATIPVIKHSKGVCHVYVDKEADQDMALAITVNAKCQRPGVCNAAETVLVHKDIAGEFAPVMAEKLMSHGVELRGDARFRALVPNAKAATDDDWDEEYLDLILACGVVDSVDEAIEHISRHGSSHSDSIVTGNVETGERFIREVDSAAVYVNASTRFTDGAQFGMGAEIGISTDRLHARGPMGLPELTTYKYAIRGDGQIME